MKHLTPIKAIKKYCKEQCCNMEIESWKKCPTTTCYLYPYRLGKRPITKTLPEQSNTQKVIDSPHNLTKNNEIKDISQTE
ncbi:MAG: hypothetical protein NTX24_02615 [Candidatus Pacearchaeota archaeon]|nr:hypothetical protein [Candidatus Pacearchaeota archaeon]